MKNILFLILMYAALFQGNLFPAQIKKDSVSVKAISVVPTLKINPTNSNTFSDLKDVGKMILRIPGDEYSFFRNGLGMTKAPVYIGLLGLTGALMKFDQRGWNYENNLYHKSSPYHRWADNFVFMGNGKFHFMLSGAFAAYGLLFHNSKSFTTAIKISEAVISSGLLVQVLKRITGRESPAIAQRSKGNWHFFPNPDEYQDSQPKYYSFPSGHLCSATATLTVIANQYPNVKWIKPVGYTILGAISLSLVSKGMHWYSDLPLGFFIGYTFGNLIAPVHTDQIPGQKISNSKLSIAPSIGINNFGLDMVYSF